MPPLRRVLPQNGSLTRVFGFLVNLRESRDDMGGDGMMGSGMMWGMGIAHLLLLLVIVLAVAALIKYVFFR